MDDCAWWEEDELARELCQLEQREIDKFRSSPLIDVAPAILPRPERIVTRNDCFDWPCSIAVDDSIVVLFDRRFSHFVHGGSDQALFDEHSGVRMIAVSPDAGMTWEEPVDLLEAGSWGAVPAGKLGGQHRHSRWKGLRSDPPGLVSQQRPRPHLDAGLRPTAVARRSAVADRELPLLRR